MSSASVYREILAWSQGQPMWQRDALRRLVRDADLGDSDVQQLVQICLDAHGIHAGSPNRPVPLSEDHLPSGPISAPTVCLHAIADVMNVNALAPGQTVEFSPEGLTIIYGSNGSGKSGYARILGQCCRARAQDVEVLGNVFSEAADGEQSAAIRYQVGPADPQEMTWRPDESAPAELAAISVFDKQSAGVYVDKDNDLAFRPMGLDLLDRLAQTCLLLKAELEDRIRKLQGQRPAALVQPPVAPTTKVGRLVSGLAAPGSESLAEELAQLSEAEVKRLGELASVLKDDPGKEAARLRTLAKRLERIREALLDIGGSLSTEVAVRLRRLQSDAAARRAAAVLAAEEAFGPDSLADVGCDAWRALWDAAREYSQRHAYPDRAFPVLDGSARCVLCQQVLGDEGTQRLIRFDDYVRGETQRLAEGAEVALREAVGRVQALGVDGSGIADALEDLSALSQEAAGRVAAFMASAQRRQAAVVDACSDGSWDGVADLAPSPLADLESVLSGMRDTASQLESAARDEERAKLVTEQRELADRQWLSGALEDVAAEICRLRLEGRLNRALGDTDTTAVTRKASDLARSVVTSGLCEAFRTELKGLGAPAMELDVVPSGGKRGVLYHRLRLTDAAGTPVANVASEGEYRCIALAAFLAELATAPDRSGIVLDDPVCSLDHVRRRRVAERLAREAEARQVVIFTHDIAFLSQLRRAPRAASVECRVQTVESVPARGHGVCDCRVPWEGANVKERLSALRRMAQDASALYTKTGRDGGAYVAAAESAYLLLRRTWERAVEEVLLGGVVQRFEPEIHTKQLRTVTDISDDDYQRLDAGMGKCSLALHDQPGAENEPTPGPDELKDDIADLDAWVNEIRQRRK